MSDDGLHLYLNDHLAGATTGRDLARTLAEHTADTGFGPEMARIADEIAEDREELERIMEAVGAKQSTVKQALGWITERLGRPAMTGGAASTGHPELGELRAFEMLSLGVEGKECLWETPAALLEPTEPGPGRHRLRRPARARPGPARGARARAPGRGGRVGATR